MLKMELKKIWDAKNSMSKDFTDLRMAVINVDKMGLNVQDLEEEVKEFGVKLQQVKDLIDVKVKEILRSCRD